ncbi:MAG: translation initiation factor IF-5A [Candidatus Aenigmatarchaeota archaeon]
MPTRQDDMKNIKEGSYIVIDGEPCVVNKRSSSSPGKHGSTKIRVVTEGILDGKRREMVKPSDEKVEVPIIDKKTGQVLSVSGNGVQLMDMESYDTFEMAVPDDFDEELNEGDEVEYWEVMGDKLLKQKK